MYQGWHELRPSGRDAQFKPLLEESDKALAAATKLSQEAQPMLQMLLSDIDKVGLDQVRAKETETAQKIDDLFGKAAEQFRRATETSKQAAQHQTDETMKAFLAKKGKGLTFFAQACDIDREIVHLVLDKSIVKLDDFLPKFKEAAGRGNAAQKNAMETNAEAEAVFKKSK